MISLKGKVALVTGAASGLGAASALLLAKHGAQVVHADLKPRPEEGWHAIDVASEAAWQEFVSHIVAKFGRLDILVNAAGISLGGDTVLECTAETWQRTMAVNLDGTFLGCKHAIPALSAGGGGAIVNFGSVLSQVGDGNAAAYVASKGGVRLLTRSIALHCAKARNNVRCNLVCPGYIVTPMVEEWLKGLPAGARGDLEARHPMKRLGRPEEVAELVLYLVSDEATAVTGGEFNADGGFTAW
jgi:NAD(P)-dependent dehydrogenase (short-subunit alcohol dehydrogenase family)